MFISSLRRNKFSFPFRPRLEILEDRTLLSVCTVDRLTDTGEGTWLQTGDLRFCINHAFDRDTIEFAVTGTIKLTRALPDLMHSIKIDGPGADLLTVRRDPGGIYRIFTVDPGAMVSIDALTIANGFAGYGGGGISNGGTLTVSGTTFTGNSDYNSGGAIYNRGILTVSDSSFSRNSAGNGGGGIANYRRLKVSNTIFSENSAGYSGYGGGAIYSYGALAVSASTFSGNYAVYGSGGGIYNASGVLTVSDSAFSGNSASAGAGGGIYNYSANLLVRDSTFSGNYAGSSGAIANESAAALTVSGSTFSGNFTRFGNGGGISNGSGTVTVSVSTFTGNSAVNSGGAIYSYGRLTVSNSTFFGNSTTSYGGGGIANDGTGTATVSDTTFSANVAVAHGGGIDNGSNYHTAALAVSNSTFSSNSSERGDGGGIYNGATLHSRNTIIAGNTAPSAPDFYGNLGSLGHNLVGNNDGGSGFDPTDLLNVDPLLGPLQDNGGPIFTMALQCGSPAIDAGDNTDAPEWDQRGEGFPRIVNKIIDIGAYEVQKGECGGPAPHGSSDRLNRLIPIPIGLAFDFPLVPVSRVANVCLSPALEMKPIPPVSQSVAATPTPPEKLSSTRPPASLRMADSLFMDPNLDCF